MKPRQVKSMKDRMTEFQPDESDLHAYVEGVLDRRGQAEVERYLLLNASTARRVAACRAQKTSLSVLLHETPLPPERLEIGELGASLAHALQRQRRFRHTLRGTAATVLFVAALSVGWVARDHVLPPGAALPSLTQQAAEGYRLFAENGGFASQPSTDGKRDPFSWLSERAGGQATASPDLGSVGFELLDGWVFPTALGEAVQLLYQDGTGQVVTLYVVYGEALPPSTFSHVQEGDLSLLFWRSGNVSYCIVGRLDQAQLVTIAELVTAELGSSEGLPLPGKTDSQPRTVDSGTGAVPAGGQTLPAKAGSVPAPDGSLNEPARLPPGAKSGEAPAGTSPAAESPRNDQDSAAPVPARPEAQELRGKPSGNA